MAALGISAGRSRDELDRYLCDELDHARLLPYGIADAFRGSDFSPGFTRTGSGGVRSRRDADFLDDSVLDVSKQNFLAHLARCDGLRACTWLARPLTAQAKRTRHTSRLTGIAGPFR